METAAIEHMSAADVLADLRACDQLERQVTARRLALAARWADLNPSIQTLPEAVDRTMTDDELGIGLAAVAEFAAVHAVTTQTGRTLIADALELRHRLPKLWHAVHELHIAAWKACAVAQTTRPRSTELAAALDTQTATLGDRLTLRRIKKLALQAVARFEPDTLPDPDTRRWLRITADTATTAGAGWVDGRLDTPDALDLETAVRAVSRNSRATAPPMTSTTAEPTPSASSPATHSAYPKQTLSAAMQRNPEPSAPPPPTRAGRCSSTCIWTQTPSTASRASAPAGQLLHNPTTRRSRQGFAWPKSARPTNS